MYLTKLEALYDRMLDDHREQEKFTFSRGANSVTVILLSISDIEASILIGASGFAKNRQPLSVLLGYHLAKPFRSTLIESDDYQILVKLFGWSPESSQKNASPFEPFNLFKLIDTNTPESLSPLPFQSPLHEAFPKDILDSIEDSAKVYFAGLRSHSFDHRHVTAQNLAKTLLYGGATAMSICSRHNISTCWTDDPEKSKSIMSALKDYC